MLQAALGVKTELFPEWGKWVRGGDFIMARHAEPLPKIHSSWLHTSYILHLTSHISHLTHYCIPTFCPFPLLINLLFKENVGGAVDYCTLPIVWGWVGEKLKCGSNRLTGTDGSIQRLSQARQVTTWPFRPLPPCRCDALCSGHSVLCNVHWALCIV